MSQALEKSVMNHPLPYPSVVIKASARSLMVKLKCGTLLTLGVISFLFFNPYPWMGVRGFGDYGTALGNPWSTA